MVRYAVEPACWVRGRNSDNTRLRQVLGWEPQVSLEEGLARTYRWIEGELRKAGRIPAAQVAPAPALHGAPADA